jgi:phosphomannomutase
VNCSPDGHFTHNPEPLPAHLTELSEVVKKNNADLGIAVDPDVDRLVFMNEDGQLFGEEYTLVAVADYVLKNHPGNTVSNLSSTRALQDVTESYGGKYSASSVGEVNVVEKMKETHAIIGGEGNGGVIYPELHYGRDALVGIALFLSHLAISGLSASALRKTYPNYFLSKNKMEWDPIWDLEPILNQLKIKYKDQPILDTDGLRVDFGNQWVHLRKSNTEPIIRIYAESTSLEKGDALAQSIMKDIQDFLHKSV